MRQRHLVAVVVVTATTAPPIPHRWLDVLSWADAGQLHSTRPTDAAPVRFHRTELSSRTVTSVVGPVAKAGLVVRVDGEKRWRPTDAGAAALKAAAVDVVVDENAIVDRAGRCGEDWWQDHYNTSPEIVRAPDGTVRIPCPGRGAAQRLIDLMAVNGVPRAALRIREAS